MVIFVFPRLQGAIFLQARSSLGPAASWIAPSTPVPPSRFSLAALTTTSMKILVVSPFHSAILPKIKLVLVELVLHGGMFVHFVGACLEGRTSTEFDD